MCFFSTAQTKVKKSKSGTKPTRPNRREVVTNKHNNKKGRSPQRWSKIILFENVRSYFLNGKARFGDECRQLISKNSRSKSGNSTLDLQQ